MVYVELRFPIVGKTVPTDHGYALFSVLSRVAPEVHDGNWFALVTLPGVARGDGVTQIDPRATLGMRLPQEKIAIVLKLAGKRLSLGDHSLRLGAPRIYSLKPSSAVYARCVTIKGYKEEEPFLAATCKRLDELGVKGEPVVGPRRVLKVGNHTIVGFGLAIHELSDDGSILLQETGLGGRRHMGCGVFNPISLDWVIGEPPRKVREVRQ